jgi:hypothetical protein
VLLFCIHKWERALVLILLLVVIILISVKVRGGCSDGAVFTSRIDHTRPKTLDVLCLHISLC